MATLKEWINTAPPVGSDSYLRQLARKCGTTDNYLSILANGHRSNPKIELVLKLVKHSKDINRTIRRRHGVIMPVLTYEDFSNADG